MAACLLKKASGPKPEVCKTLYLPLFFYTSAAQFLADNPAENV